MVTQSDWLIIRYGVERHAQNATIQPWSSRRSSNIDVALTCKHVSFYTIQLHCRCRLGAVELPLWHSSSCTSHKSPPPPSASNCKLCIPGRWRWSQQQRVLSPRPIAWWSSPSEFHISWIGSSWWLAAWCNIIAVLTALCRRSPKWWWWRW